MGASLSLCRFLQAASGCQSSSPALPPAHSPAALSLHPLHLLCGNGPRPSWTHRSELKGFLQLRSSQADFLGHLSELTFTLLTSLPQLTHLSSGSAQLLIQTWAVAHLHPQPARSCRHEADTQALRPGASHCTRPSPCREGPASRAPYAGTGNATPRPSLWDFLKQLLTATWAQILILVRCPPPGAFRTNPPKYGLITYPSFSPSIQGLGEEGEW